MKRRSVPVIYLASQSPRRKEILKKMGIPFRVVKSSYEEKFKKCSPAKLVMDHAVGKAQGAQVVSKQGCVLGSDTIVYCRGKVLGKPKTISRAVKMLEFISNRPHFVYTGVALKNLASGKIVKGFEKTKVFIKKLSRAEISKYIPKVNSLDKAGAYAIQMKPSIVKKIEGSYSNVVGLPEKLVRKMISSLLSGSQ